jgi:hypothetical protein
VQQQGSGLADQAMETRMAVTNIDVEFRNRYLIPLKTFEENA